MCSVYLYSGQEKEGPGREEGQELEGFRRADTKETDSHCLPSCLPACLSAGGF